MYIKNIDCRNNPVKSRSLKPFIKRFLKDNSGQGLAEYLILLLLIAIVSITSAKMLGSVIKTRIDTARQKIVDNIPTD